MAQSSGLLIAVCVVAANTPGREGAKQLLNQLRQERAHVPRLVRIWVDGGFSREDFWMGVMNTCRWIIEVALRHLLP